jgi:hypothetical protein
MQLFYSIAPQSTYPRIGQGAKGMCRRQAQRSLGFPPAQMNHSYHSCQCNPRLAQDLLKSEHEYLVT